MEEARPPPYFSGRRGGMRHKMLKLYPRHRM
jgi:hypothetical protein